MFRSIIALPSHVRSRSPEGRAGSARLAAVLLTAAAGCSTVAAQEATDAAVELETIEVRGEAEDARGPVDGYVAEQSATGTKTDTPLIETPQSVSVVTADQIAAQGAQSVGEALRYTAGVQPEQYGSDARMDWIGVRGFWLPDVYLDGMRLPHGGFIWPSVEPYGVERVEVLKGPASVLYGQSPPGGLINVVSKRPPAEPFHEVLFQVGSFDYLGAAFDIGGPIDPSGEFLYRVTGIGHMSGNQVDFVDDDQLFLAPSVTWRPDADTKLTIYAQFQRDRLDDWTSTYFPAEGTLLPNPNGEIPSSRNLGEPGFDYYERDQIMAGYEFEHRFNDVWTARQNFRYVYLKGDTSIVHPTGFEPDLRTLDRTAFRFADDIDSVTLDNQLQAEFDTAVLHHTMLFGLDFRAVWDRDRFWSGTVDSIDAFDPVYGAEVSSLTPGGDTDHRLMQTGVYLQDQIKFDRVVLLLGGRYDWADSRDHDRLADATTEQDASAFSGRAGLLYHFDNGLAPYASYSSSFEPVVDTDFSGSPFDPTTGEQFEVGMKYQPPGLDSLITLALFDLRQQNVLTPDPDPDHAFFSVQTGEVRVRGFEAEGKASLTDSLDLIGTYTYSDSEIAKSSDPLELGNEVALIPKHQASLWADYTIGKGPLDGLGFGAGIRYIGTLYGDNYNEFRSPAVTLFDAAAHYHFGARFPELDGLALQVTASNLANEEYIASCFGLAACFYGAGRTVYAQLKYQW